VIGKPRGRRRDAEGRFHDRLLRVVDEERVVDDAATGLHILERV
jgi:hypothetical protein